jgi:MFS family permease
MTEYTTTPKRDRHLRLLLGGFSVSMLGSRVTTIAYPMLVLRLTHSPVTAGWVACAVIVPSMLIYVPAGALVDRWPPRRALVVSEFLRGAAIVTVIAMVAWFKARCVPLLIGPAVIEECLGAFSVLAERRYVRLLVQDDSLTPALVGSEARTHLVVLLARPLGGLLFEVHYLLPFWINLATFSFSVLSLSYMRFQGRSISIVERADDFGFTSDSKRASETTIMLSGSSARVTFFELKNDVRVALRWVRDDQFARVAIPLSASSSLVAQALVIVFLTEATHRHMSPFTLGVVLAASGVGGTIGSMFAPKIRSHVVLSWIFFLMLAWSATLLLLVNGGVSSSIRTAAVMALFGFTGALGNIELNEYLMGKAKETMLARVLSFRQFSTIAACAIGPALGGALVGWRGESHPIRWLFLLTFCIALVAWCAFRLSFHQDADEQNSYWRAPLIAPAGDQAAGSTVLDRSAGDPRQRQDDLAVESN